MEHNPEATDLAHLQALREAAEKVLRQAYAPYSNFQVGAAILTARGQIYAGCNVECADFDGTHAEESALSAMVAAGDRSPVLLVVLGRLAEQAESKFIVPCGKCRQKLKEFSSLSRYDLNIFINDMNKPHIVLLSDLLPRSFGPADIGVDLAKHRR